MFEASIEKNWVPKQWLDLEVIFLTKGNTLWARQRKGNLDFWEGKYKGKLVESKGYFSKLFVCFVGFHL